MCELAVALKSKWIFREASVYVIGSSHQRYEAKQPKLAKDGLDRLFAQKRMQFVEKFRACELAMFELQPRTQEYDYRELHLAVMFFRHWLSQELVVQRGSHITPGYAKTYRTIGKCKSPFANGSEREEMLDHISRVLDCDEETVPKIEVELAHVFCQAAQSVQHILKDATLREDKMQRVSCNLKFMVVEENELPWMTG